MDRLQRIYQIARRECRMLRRRPVFFFVMVIEPIVCVLFFTSLMGEGLPTNLPAGVVDADNTRITRILCRTMDAMELTDVKYKYHTFSEAHEAMRRGEIYAFYYISKGTTEEALASRQPKVSFYTNDAYLVPANLLMKEMKTTSELISLAIFREKLRAKGVREDDMLAWLQPIAIETHPIGNPTLDYNVYLTNMVVPGIFILLILLSATYTIGIEWKNETQHELYQLAGQSQTVALIGKLLPQTAIFVTQWLLMDIWLFWHCGFPCQCGIGVMMLLGMLTVVASQAFAVLLFGIMAGNMRLSMCICSLWGILSFSLAGFTYPVTDMHVILRALAPLFPLRHYYLIYVNQALNGFPISDVWFSVTCLVAFCFCPLLVGYRYRKAFLTFKYLP